MSKLDHMFEMEPATVRRLEVFNGTGRRRRFSDEFKARIVEETIAPGFPRSLDGMGGVATGLHLAPIARECPGNGGCDAELHASGDRRGAANPDGRFRSARAETLRGPQIAMA